MPEPNFPAGDPSEEDDPDPADLWFPAVSATAQDLTLLRDEIAVWAARTGLPPDRLAGVRLAVYEAMANVVVHAYPGRRGTFTLFARSRAGDVTVTVADHGRWQPAARPGLLHGRGLPLIHTLADHATVDKGAAGTSVTMTWSRCRADSPAMG